MDYIQKLRIKTAMIIYELELSLGNYIIENEIPNNIPDKSKHSIIERERIKGNIINKDDINIIIEASYLDEIFNFAINVTEGTLINDYVIELKQLCSFLGIFDIRNSVSHPNRPFPECYWFRAASIASDPLIEKLGLSAVKNALKSAIEENLSYPPDEWLYNVSWAIPNTLPQSFDHEITGLLGRDKEFKDLETVLSRERNNLVAIVAPGGIGKTALVLQFLKDISLSPNWSKKLSSIIFCTLKNERLTANGIEVIEAIDGIEQIKQSILENLRLLYNKPEIDNLDNAIQELGDEAILICIDNLETLLVDSQREFLDFNQSLPIKWRVLVTSRISLDSATTVPLEPLGKRHAVILGRNYLKKRGIINFKQDDLEKIADNANNNPLAIRLTIDLYIKGVDISQSINKSQRDIASFSYKNLIESLKENSITNLEAIYALGTPTKADLIDFLDLSNEEITESTNELAKTSLIIRRSNEFGNDIFSLSESIRDLLLTNPRNIEVRNKITEDLKKRKAKILEQTTRSKKLRLTEFDEEFVAEGLDTLSYSLIADLNKLLANLRGQIIHGDLVSIKERFDDIIRFRQNDAIILFHYSRIFRELKDTPNELFYLQKADSLTYSPRIKLGIAMHYFYNSDYEYAVSYFEELISKEYDKPESSSKKFSFTIIKLYYLCLLYLGQYDKILTLTSDWQDHVNWKSLKGIYRATALKRKMEYRYEAVSTNEKFVEEIFTILGNVFDSENYIEVGCVEANKIIKDLYFLLNKQFPYSERIQLEYLKFIAKHFFNIISKLRSENINSVDNQKFLERMYNFDICDNPLHRVDWYVGKNDEKNYDKEHIEELIEQGYEIVKVYHIPEDKGYGISSFMFAENRNGNQFYLSVNNFNEGWNRWGYININSELGIKYDIIQNNGKPTPATEIVEIDQY